MEDLPLYHVVLCGLLNTSLPKIDQISNGIQLFVNVVYLDVSVLPKQVRHPHGGNSDG